MKKRKAVLIILLCIAVGGISSGMYFFVSKESNKTIKDTAEDKTLETSSDLDEYQYYFNYNEMTESDKGYYYWKDNYLYFYDKSSNVAVPLCNKPECSHEDESCNAYFDDSFLTTGVEYADGKLYVIACEGETLTSAYLYEISEDGSERKKLYEVYTSDTGDMFYDVMIHKGYLYTTEDSKLYRRALTEDAQAELIYKEDGDNISFGSQIGFGNAVYFTKIDQSNSTVDITLLKYDLATDNVEVIKDNFISDQYYITGDNKVYYFMDNMIQLYDMETKESKDIVTLDENTVVNFDGTYIYAYSQKGILDIYDLTGTLIEEIMKYGCYIGSDEDYLIVESFEDDCTMEMLDKSQIGTGKQDWITIE